MTMRKIHKTISVKAPRSQLYEYVTHPENLPEIWPSIVGVSHVTRTPDGSHSFDWVYKLAGVHFKGHAVTLDVKQNERIVVKNAKGIPCTFHWTYSGENGGTKVVLEVEYSLPSHLLEQLTEPFLDRVNEREAETVLENLKSRMELQARAVASKAEMGASPSGREDMSQGRFTRRMQGCGRATIEVVVDADGRVWPANPLRVLAAENLPQPGGWNLTHDARVPPERDGKVLTFRFFRPGSPSVIRISFQDEFSGDLPRGAQLLPYGARLEVHEGGEAWVHAWGMPIP